MNELVQKLTKPQHVEATVRPERTVEGFKAALDRGYVHVKFTQTRGGTELGIPLDPAESDLSGADFAAGTGKVGIVGELILDYVKVRFRGHVELPGLEGEGFLEPLGEVEPGSELEDAEPAPLAS